MILFPTCKINLGLYITEKRSDGFHNLETVMLELPFTDIMEIVVSESAQFKSTGLIIPGNGNLCLNALNLLQKESKKELSTFIHLHKQVPMGAGLGGGSSDAAFTLKLLNVVHDLRFSTNELEHFASILGSDCAFFIRGGMQFCTGRGEVLTSIDHNLNGKHIVLVNDGTHVSTKDAFSKVIPSKNECNLMELVKLPVKKWQGKIFNQFENSVFTRYPSISKIKEKFINLGAEYASMSGSGATVYGIFDELPVGIENSFIGCFVKTLSL
jgi:4-diphosphocytidyl-2-C-methyl-D-erythritol kinase